MTIAGNSPKGAVPALTRTLSDWKTCDILTWRIFFPSYIHWTDSWQLISRNRQGANWLLEGIAGGKEIVQVCQRTGWDSGAMCWQSAMAHSDRNVVTTITRSLYIYYRKHDWNTWMNYLPPLLFTSLLPAVSHWVCQQMLHVNKVQSLRYSVSCHSKYPKDTENKGVSSPGDV